MQEPHYPGGLTELEFLDAYCQSALRKPQVVADSALRTLVLAGTADRATLCGLIAEQLAEACRRLAAVHAALSDRTCPVARSLMAPLAGVTAWLRFAQLAGTLTPEQMLRDLNLGELARESAERLRSQPGLTDLAPFVAAVEAGQPAVLVADRNGHRVATAVWLSGVGSAGEPVLAAVGADEGAAATLADLTADLCSIARAFLASYIESRRTAGRRP